MKKKLKSDSQSNAAACSLSSTPETEAVWRKRGGLFAMDAHSRKMEIERDAAIAVISAIEERFTDGCDTYEDWKFMGDTARAFLSENAQGEPSADSPTH